MAKPIFMYLAGNLSMRLLIMEEHDMEDSKDMVPCIECGKLFTADELRDGLCPDCRELMDAEIDWEDTEDY